MQISVKIDQLVRILIKKTHSKVILEVHFIPFQETTQTNEVA